MKVFLRLCIAGVVLGVLALGGYFLLSGGSTTTTNTATSTPVIPDGTPISVETLKTATYQSLKYKFSLELPPGMTLKTYDEGLGATTFSFQNSDPEDVKGLQIFIVPYAGATIDKDRFLLDNPSGIMTQPRDGLLAGVSARMFYSKDPILGDTREIWFIKNGYLYEVTTVKVLDEWLQSIMMTWKFL